MSDAAKNTNLLVTHEIYLNFLKNISGIEFTQREIDIVACIINHKQPTEIAHFLSINKKTVSTHILHIKTKLGVSLREKMIDFIKRSDKFYIIHQQYFPSLLIRVKFEEILKRLSQKVKEDIPLYYETNRQNHKNLLPLVSQLKHHFQLAGICIRDRTSQGYKSFSENNLNSKEKKIQILQSTSCQKK